METLARNGSIPKDLHSMRNCKVACQQTSTCSESTKETLEKSERSVQKLSIKTPKRRHDVVLTSFWCL